MVSFSCENCGDVLTKKKLDPHRNQCRGASFTCLDCMVHFYGTEYRTHTSCISEAQKYQGHLYREKDKKDNKSEKRKSLSGKYGDNMVPMKAYVEDAPDEGEAAIAIIDVPPRAPTPPPAHEALPETVNVFDYLIAEEQSTGNAQSQPIQAPDESKMITDSQYSQLSNGKGSQYQGRGFSYGNMPIEPTFERYDSWSRFPDSQQQQSQNSQSMAPPAYYTKIVTPGPDRDRKHKDDKSGQKRKRVEIDDLDLTTTIKRPASRDEPMTDAPNRILHSGLTGGLTRLVTDSSFYEDRIDAGPTPISPIKRSKHDREPSKRHSSYASTKVSTSSRQPVSSDDRHQSRRREPEYHNDKRSHVRRRRSPSSSSDDDRSHRRHSTLKAIDFKAHTSRNSSVQPTSHNQLVMYSSKAELFMSFITKGPDSERGCSINKALKRYHREKPATKSDEREDDDKDLWKSLRLKKNDRGEIVLFVAE